MDFQLLAILAGVAILAVGFGLVARRSSWRQRAASGWDDWRRTARALPWGDRWKLAVSTTTGRPVSDPRLAPYAVQRSTAAQILLVATRRRLSWLCLVSAPLFLAGGVLALVVERDWSTAGRSGALALLWLSMPWLSTREAVRAGRSADANRRLTGAA